MAFSLYSFNKKPNLFFKYCFYLHKNRVYFYIKKGLNDFFFFSAKNNTHKLFNKCKILSLTPPLTRCTFVLSKETFNHF